MQVESLERATCVKPVSGSSLKSCNKTNKKLNFFAVTSKCSFHLVSFRSARWKFRAKKSYKLKNYAKDFCTSDVSRIINCYDFYVLGTSAHLSIFAHIRSSYQCDWIGRTFTTLAKF